MKTTAPRLRLLALGCLLLSSLVAGVTAQDATKEAKEPAPKAKTGKTAKAEGGTGEKDTKDKEKGTGAIRGRNDPMDNLFNIVQTGRTQEGVHLPLDENGVVKTIVDADKMTRVDEHNIEFENAVINQKQKDGAIVHMPRGYYNKQEDLLLSTQPSVVESPQYRIEGDALSVDRKTNSYRMNGRVRFMYFGATQLGGVSAQADRSAEVKPAAPPAPNEVPAPAPATVKAK